MNEGDNLTRRQFLSGPFHRISDSETPIFPNRLQGCAWLERPCALRNSNFPSPRLPQSTKPRTDTSTHVLPPYKPLLVLSRPLRTSKNPCARSPQSPTARAATPSWRHLAAAPRAGARVRATSRFRIRSRKLRFGAEKAGYTHVHTRLSRTLEGSEHSPLIH